MIIIHELCLLRSTNRGRRTRQWFSQGGVLIIGYNMLTAIVDEMDSDNDSDDDVGWENKLLRADLIICDEAHLLKNPNSKIFKAVNRMSTMRRIMLSGTPLQNNLEEYFWLIQLIKPNLFGPLKKFQENFVDPIRNGRQPKATPIAKSIMKKRVYIMNRFLEGYLHRADHSTISSSLEPKHDYVVYVRLTPLQFSLYEV